MLRSSNIWGTSSRRSPTRVVPADPRIYSRGDSRGDSRGELLLELLMTTSIVTICVIGLVGALGSNFRFSAVSREINNADQLLARYAEAMSAVPYEACGAKLPYQKAGVDNVPSRSLPKNVTTGVPGAIAVSSFSFAFTVESVQYWQGDTSPATFVAQCTGSDPGIQRLVLSASAGDGSLVRRTTIVKRAP